MTVISVIGPDARVVEQVTAGVRALDARTGGSTRRRYVAGAGPGEADGVVAVVSPDGSGGAGGAGGADLEVLRAVRDAMGVVVLYAPASAHALTDEAGVVHCTWEGDSAAAPGQLAGLSSVLDTMWVDSARWESDARRADAERLDRVRIAVRLAADRAATALLDGQDGSAAGFTAGELDARFRARLSVAVLEQGVDMPHLAPAETPQDAGASGAAGASGTSGMSGMSGRLVTAAAALGAGLAAAAGVLRLTDSLLAALAAGVVVAGATAGARWWAGRAARREREAARLAAALRRHWAATVTDVVARLVVPPVAGTVKGAAS
ncbi:hypothetical protein ACT3SZ_10740 [Corynebacterium sp. AOP40-9SA-29]|uniref:hypothetical protein n=1 Tax=Corynebacterium sp. AOP40-9SA-29 TaxID=3457677 RepID=UPI0040335AEE